MIKFIKQLALPALTVTALIAAPVANAAAAKKTLCVFDIVGTQGDVYNMMKDYKLAALNWGVDFDLKSYTDEKIAADDFKANRCDAVAITGIRGREFNPFSGSIDSIGGLPTYEHLKMVIQTVSKPEAAKLMTNGNYEVAGVVPGGAAYLFLRDRTIDNVAKLSGKRIGVLEYDQAQPDMVNKVGAAVVNTTITNFAGKFNNGTVDAVPAPALAYQALELYKGLNPNSAANPPGGIVRFALAQLTMQLILHKDAFPADYGQKSREYSLSQFDKAMEIINRATNSIDSKYWIDLPEKDKIGYMEMFRQARLSLKQKGIYDAKMLSVMFKVRCKMEPQNPECSAPDHE
ncbi:MAG TPA: putative solute-binding protein [Pseudomonadales bacterium]|nr:putative solute-binding protein [Pseudomonadales bacterium]